jgi:hypothetical protein
MIILFLILNGCQQGDSMQRAMVWFNCAALHDPVRPVIKQAAIIGWEAKQRQIDLVVETRDPDQMDAISQKLADAFGEEAWLEPIAKTLLT